jgi:alkylation response protein AidB-like acyl-CoA dehydrogenase
MSVADTVNDEDLRAEVRAWLQAHWTDEMRKKAVSTVTYGVAQTQNLPWMRMVLDAGWRVPRWPVECHGRGLSNAQQKIVEEEFARVGAPGPGNEGIPAGVIYAYGNQFLKRELMGKFLTGELAICLLYSEPNAGSDLAAVRTRAELDDDHYVVNGSKIWTSGARGADYGLLLARTDWDAPKHRGLSFFLFPMKQEGVEVRPLHQITGDRHFNEVFFTDAVAPARNLVGEEGSGWMVLQTALAYERQIMGGAAGRRAPRGEGDPLRMLRAARERGRLQDPLIRQNIARIMALKELNTLNMQRALREVGDGTSSPIMSLGKLAMSRSLHGEARVMSTILGADSMLHGQENEEANTVNTQSFTSFITSIGGGSDQIQRNIISERVLGLPREVEMDRDVPFRESRAVKGDAR